MRVVKITLSAQVVSVTAISIVKRLRLRAAIQLVKRLVRPVLRRAAAPVRYVLRRLLAMHFDMLRDQVGDAETAIRAVQFDLRAMQRHLALLEDRLNSRDGRKGRDPLS